MAPQGLAGWSMSRVKRAVVSSKGASVSCDSARRWRYEAGVKGKRGAKGSWLTSETDVTQRLLSLPTCATRYHSSPRYRSK